MTSFFPVGTAIQRATIAPEARSAILAAGDSSTAADARLLPDRPPFVADPAPGVPLPGLRRREPAAGRRLRPGRRPRVESRSPGARAPDLAAPFPALHGQVGALLVPALGGHRGRRRVQGEPRARRPRRDRDGREAGAGRQRDRDVPRRHPAQEGPAEEVRGARAHRRRPHRAGGGRAARAGRDQRHGRVEPACRVAGELRRTDRAGRPARPGAGRRGARGDRAPDGRDPQAGGVAVKGLLLAIDGDSLAHRAYHALPKSIRLNALVGFANFLMRLWDAEQPESVLVGWDSLETPTYRHEALPAYQSGRVFEPSILEQLDLLPALVESFGFQVGKAGGYEADDFLAAAARAWPGPVVVATSDRDAFQLVSERVTIVQPVKGVSEVARVGPAEVRERYGVEPAQVPDFIALRGDPSDKIPGAPGVGPKKAAVILAEHGTLENTLAAGRFEAEAEDLRLYRRIAQMDASAPLPPLSHQTPTWAEASSFVRALGLTGLADRLASRA